MKLREKGTRGAPATSRTVPRKLFAPRTDANDAVFIEMDRSAVSIPCPKRDRPLLYFFFSVGCGYQEEIQWRIFGPEFRDIGLEGDD